MVRTPRGFMDGNENWIKEWVKHVLLNSLFSLSLIILFSLLLSKPLTRKTHVLKVFLDQIDNYEEQRDEHMNVHPWFSRNYEKRNETETYQHTLPLIFNFDHDFIIQIIKQYTKKPNWPFPQTKPQTYQHKLPLIYIFLSIHLFSSNKN